MSKFYYMDHYWDGADLVELSSKTWEDIPQELMKYSSIHGSDVFTVYEIAETREISIKELKEELKRKQELDKETKAREKRRLAYEKLKEEFGG